MPKTFALKLTVYEADEKRKLMVARYISVADGLTWQQAKERRAKDRRLSIVPKRIVTPKLPPYGVPLVA